MAPGEVFAGRFLIIDLLGSGGFGNVYRAKDLRLGRELALKVLHVESEPHREMLLAEARTAIKLEHPNIVQVHDAGEHDGKPWLAMALVAGRTIKDLIDDEGAIPLPRALRIVDQASAALDHSHRMGFVHRDIKPANLLLQEDDRLVVLDFGIAAARRDPMLAERGLEGTPGYIAPELVSGAPPSPRSDQFALGATVYCMLTGQPAFKGRTAEELLHSVKDPAPPQRQELRRDLSRGSWRALARSLAKEPADRHADCGAFAAALRRSARLAVLRRVLVLAGAAAALVAGAYSLHAWSARPPEVAFRIVAEARAPDGTRSVGALAPGARLRTNDRFFLDDVTMSRDGFLSVFLLSSEGEFQPLLPRLGAPPLSLRAGQPTRLPTGDAWELDERAGTETLYLVASSRVPSASDLLEIQRAAGQAGGAASTATLTRGVKGHDAARAARELRAKAIEEVLTSKLGRTHQVEIVHE